MGLNTITLLCLCHVWNDNRKRQATSRHAFKTRPNLISNEGFALARNCLDKAFLSEIVFFFFLFLSENQIFSLLVPFVSYKTRNDQCYSYYRCMLWNLHFDHKVFVTPGAGSGKKDLMVRGGSMFKTRAHYELSRWAWDFEDNDKLTKVVLNILISVRSADQKS